MKIVEIVDKNDVELTDLIAKQRQALAEAAVEARTKEVRNVKAQANLKRTLARALTIQRQREIVTQESNQEATS